MKKLMFLFIAVIGFSVATEAQVNVSINIGTQPAWGPIGYDYVDYYYLPDIESYYYVPGQVYIYRSGNSWRRSRQLPARYSYYNVYNSHKVVINGVNKPYLQDTRYRRSMLTIEADMIRRLSATAEKKNTLKTGITLSMYNG
jgi:hypothetical protein